jgi:hypothetical protein
MSFAISNTYPTTAAEPVLQNVPKAAAPVAPATSVPEDTVKLSQSAQIQALSQSGDSAASIASSLGVSVASVDSILGIVTAVTVAMPASGGHKASPHAAVSQPVAATTTKA